MFTLRRATLADANALADLGARTFRETFARDNTPQDMASYLAGHFGADLQRAELEDASVQFILLETEGRPAGYVKLRSGPSRVEGQRPLEICRFYIDRAWHGAGAAQQLMEGVFALAREAGHDALWLAVWEHNARALRFYQKLGFARVGEQPFRLGSDVQTDWLMARRVEGPG